MSVQEYACQVKSRRDLTPTVFEVAFETEQPLNFQAGQFISVVIPGAGPKGRDLRRAYSIASSPEKSVIELCVKLVEGGPGTNYLNRLQVGERFRGFAPYGDFVYEPKEGRRAMFIATGTGIAPFRAMLASRVYLSQPPVKTTCLLGVRTEDEVLYTEELANLAGLEWVPTVSQPKADWQGFRGRVTEYLRSLPADYAWSETEFYLCGNGQMIAEVKTILGEKGVLKDSIHQEKYY
jgi:NAD(P)H-flavin reductase